MRIKVDHQLQRTSQMEYVIRELKTESGVRYVPMTEEAAAWFRRIIANREASKVEPMVDDHIRFLYLDKNDMPMDALHWEKYLEHIIEKYNKTYRIQMPKVTQVKSLTLPTYLPILQGQIWESMRRFEKILLKYGTLE